MKFLPQNINSNGLFKDSASIKIGSDGKSKWDFNYLQATPFYPLGNTLSDYSVAIDQTLKTRWAWGYNIYGQLGDNTLINKSIPISVSGNHLFIQIAGGQYHSLALKDNGEVWAWGLNSEGQLGDGTSTNSGNKSTPVSVSGNHSFIQIAGGYSRSLALKANGEVWAWGGNSAGQLGDNTIVSKSVPVSISGNHSFIQIAGGSFHSLALKANREVWAWGGNSAGQLGDNTLINKSIPISVSGNHSFIQIAGGHNHSLALNTNGEIWAWGYNIYGQLGDNTSVQKNSPVPVVGNHSFIQIAAGISHSLALKENGEVWTWGYNYFSQLGDGTSTASGNKSVPVSILGNHSFIQVAGGDFHSLALKENGEVWTWGYNINGQLGDNTTVQKNSPVLVQKLFK